MIRFLFLIALFAVATGLALHFQAEIPGGVSKWIGRLPGDLIIKKNGTTIYLPLTTALIASSVLSLLLSFAFKSGK